MKKRTWSERLKRVRRLKSKTDRYNQTRQIIGEYIGEALDKFEMLTIKDRRLGLRFLRDIFNNTERLFERNVFIEDNWVIGRYFMREVVAQYLSFDGTEDRVMVVFATIGILKGVRRYTKPSEYIKEWSSVIKCGDEGREYKLTTFNIHPVPLGTVLTTRFGNKTYTVIIQGEDGMMELEANDGKIVKRSVSDLTEKYIVVSKPEVVEEKNGR
jgi:hypothetical protein